MGHEHTHACTHRLPSLQPHTHPCSCRSPDRQCPRLKAGECHCLDRASQASRRGGGGHPTYPMSLRRFSLASHAPSQQLSGVAGSPVTLLCVPPLMLLQAQCTVSRVSAEGGQSADVISREKALARDPNRTWVCVQRGRPSFPGESLRFRLLCVVRTRRGVRRVSPKRSWRRA